MASTNKTTNYELSQFIGTDKPAWLADYNTDMSKIDAQMKLNADNATAADGKADVNTVAIGTLSNLTTDAKTNVVAAINEVDSHADTAQNTASQGATVANNAKTAVDALSRYFSIVNTGACTVSISGGTAGNITDLRYGLNADGTLGKIYGRYRYTVNRTSATSITITIPNLNVDSDITINGACYYTSLEDGEWNIINAREMTLHSNGTATIEFPSMSIGASITIWLPPCLYFFTDFGDVINPNN